MPISPSPNNHMHKNPVFRSNLYDFEKHKELVAMHPGDVPVTYADTSALERDFGFKTNTSLREGLKNFVKWYKEFYCK